MEKRYTVKIGDPFGGYAILAEQSIRGLVEGVKASFGQLLRDSLLPIAYDRVLQDFDAINMLRQYKELYEQYK